MTDKITIAGVEYEPGVEFEHVNRGKVQVWKNFSHGHIAVTSEDGGAWESHESLLILPPSPAEQWDKALEPLWALLPGAHWAAKDADGTLSAYIGKPSLVASGVFWCGPRVVNLGLHSTLSAIPIPWHESLRKRPEGK